MKLTKLVATSVAVIAMLSQGATAINLNDNKNTVSPNQGVECSIDNLGIVACEAPPALSLEGEEDIEVVG